MSWAHPEWLPLLPLAISALAVAEWAGARRRRRLLEALRVDPAPGGWSASVLVAVAAACIVVGLAGPLPGRAEGTNDARRNVALVLDVSRSMAVRDVQPSRALVARLAALRVATTAADARVGVVAFAADAHLLVPPTEDRGLVNLYVESLDPEALSAQGSDLARALQVAIDAVEPAGAVVLFSDGEGFQEERALEDALDRARAAGVVVHTVAVGTAGGGVVPGVLTGGRSRARPEVLGLIARRTGGVAADGADGPSVAALLARLEAREQRTSGRGGSPAPLPTSWPAAAALIFLLADTVLAARRRGRVPV